MIRETARTIASVSKHALRNFVPDFLLKRGISSAFSDQTWD